MFVGGINKVIVLTELPDETLTSQFYAVVRQGSTILMHGIRKVKYISMGRKEVVIFPILTAVPYRYPQPV